MQKPDRRKDSFVRKEVKEFEEEVIQIDRVTRVVKGGRKMRFRATVAIGNRKGRVGIGVGKSNEVTGAIQKAIAKAKKEMIKVTMDGNTIPHEVKLKYKSARLLIMPAGPGTGLIAGSSIRKVLELSGIKDILSKCFGTKNKVNNSKAIFEALKSLKANPRMLRKAKEDLKKTNQPPVDKPAAPEEKPKEEAAATEAVKQ